jgi:hypothetical protein
MQRIRSYSKVEFRLFSIPELRRSAEEERREMLKFVTKGKEGKHDPVGVVLTDLFAAMPEFAGSIMDKDARRNGWTLRGVWPQRGKQLFQWEVEAWGERGGDVVFKVNLWADKGWHDGWNFRTGIPRSKKVAKKFRKWFVARKAEIEKSLPTNRPLLGLGGD